MPGGRCAQPALASEDSYEDVTIWNGYIARFRRPGIRRRSGRKGRVYGQMPGVPWRERRGKTRSREDVRSDYARSGIEGGAEPERRGLKESDSLGKGQDEACGGGVGGTGGRH